MLEREKRIIRTPRQRSNNGACRTVTSRERRVSTARWTKRHCVSSSSLRSGERDWAAIPPQPSLRIVGARHEDFVA
jgi:hypothetical protein